MAGPLDGVNVLEFSQVIAAPLAGQLLAEMGANVLKVEPPTGDSWRLQLSFAPGESRSFQTLNRGKRDIILQMMTADAQAIVHRLVPDMDVVLINYRPDVPARMNIDYEALRALRPDLVYADLTAFGRRGPWAMRPGYDGVVQAVTGLMAGEAKLREDGSPATIASTAIADCGSGMILADAIIAALYHRARTGEGQLVECSLFATALNLQGEWVMEHGGADEERNRVRDDRHRSRDRGESFDAMTRIRRSGTGIEFNVDYRCWLTSDGAVAVAARTPGEIRQWRALLAALGTAAQGEAMAALFSSRETAHWLERCREYQIPAAPVHFPVELMDHEQVTANDIMMSLEHETTGRQTVVGSPLTFSASGHDGYRASPPLGRDTDAVLRELGYTDDKIAEWRASGGVIS